VDIFSERDRLRVASNHELIKQRSQAPALKLLRQRAEAIVVDSIAAVTTAIKAEFTLLAKG